MSTKTRILLCNAWLCGIKLRCAKHILQRCGIRICTLRWKHPVSGPSLRRGRVHDWRMEKIELSYWVSRGCYQRWVRGDLWQMAIYTASADCSLPPSPRFPISMSHCLNRQLNTTTAVRRNRQQMRSLQQPHHHGLSIFISLTLIFFPLHFLSVNVWLALMTIQFSVQETGFPSAKGEKALFLKALRSKDVIMVQLLSLQSNNKQHL